MADRFEIFLGELALEVRYAYGHRYFDQCGQTLIDIERSKPDWVAGDPTPQSGSLQNPKRNYFVAFDARRFVISAIRPRYTQDFAEEAHSLWAIVRDNLGLSDFLRLGCRFNYYLPTRSIGEAEAKLAKASLNVTYPDILRQKHYEPKFREMMLTLEREGVEYRVVLRGVTRTESAIPASSLLTADPRSLSTHQKEARLEAIKARTAYSKSPEYAVHLDIDCAQFEPRHVKPNVYVLECESVLQADFAHIVDFTQMNRTATVISLADRIASTATVTDHAETPESGSNSVSYLGNSQRERTRSRRAPQPSQLDRAFAGICATLTDDVGDVERSNSFDEWKEAVHEEALTAMERSPGSRQILGILLAATRQKDVTDFEATALRSFRAVTNTLRRPNVSLLDVKTVIKYLKTAGINALLPLEVGDISEPEKLDKFLEDLVAKHS